jgi:hypothetical protein
MPVWEVAKAVSVGGNTPGTTFETLSDGSVLVSGPHAAASEFSFSAEVADVNAVTGLRLEAIPDPRLPQGGAGRAPDGSFVVSEVSVDVSVASRPTATTPLVRQKPQADFSSDGFPVAHAADNDGSSKDRGWSVSPRQQEIHWAVFELSGAPEIKEPARVTVKIRHAYTGGQHELGRFRISFTSSPFPHVVGVAARAAELAAIPRERRSAEEHAELAALVAARDPLRETFTSDLAVATRPVARDPKLTALAADLADAEKPLADDPVVVRLRSDVAASAKQLADRRLTAIQDLAWALVNSPAFFFNH